MTSYNDPFTILATVKEQGKYSSRNASKGALLPELQRMLMGLKGDYSKEKAREIVFVENIFNKKTFENRKAIWDRLNHRYFNIQSEWIVSSLIKVATSGAASADFISLAYLYYALRDRITYDFVVSVIWKKWSQGLTNVNNSDFFQFMDSNLEGAPELRAWRETTRNRLSTNTLAALRDFGLLAGKAIKRIQRPTISPETSYHLLAILLAEGKRGRAILEAEDWKLFLWNDTDITNALVRMAQLGWIKFERGGQTVILEMVRMPRVTLEEAHGNKI